MYYKLIYISQSKEKKNIFRLYLVNVVFDLVKCALIDIPQFILIAIIFSFLFRESSSGTTTFIILIALLLVAQLIYVLLNQFRKREPYVFINRAGITLHARNFENYGIGVFPKQDIFIAYDEIKDCYISVPYTMGKNIGFAYKNMLTDATDFFKGRIGFRHKTEQPHILPSIADGRYDCKCVLVRLHNKYTIVLPIDNCEQFLQSFKKYSAGNGGE